MRIGPIASLVFALILSGTGAVSANTLYGIGFPETVSGFSLIETTNLERNNPGQGYELDYTLPGWTMDLFVYDLRRVAIPADPRSAIVRAEFERSREGAFLPFPSGPYAQVFLRRNFTVQDAGKVTRFQCAAFHMRRDGAKPQDGFLCVTSLRNKFVKLRLTTLSHEGSEPQAHRHISAWIPVLWNGARPGPTPTYRPAAVVVEPVFPVAPALPARPAAAVRGQPLPRPVQR